MNEFVGKVAAVIGLARAGVPAAKFLRERGAEVVGYDSKPREQLSSEALELETLGVKLQSGEHGFAGIEACDLIVLSPGLKVHFEPLLSVIEAAEARGTEVIGELELAYRFCPCPIVGVTGTKGKSTTTKLITEMLRACGVAAVAAGNTGTPLISVLPQLAPDSWAVVEVSSFQLEKAPTFRPKVAVLLSLLEDHQDYHPNLEQYWETKLKLFQNQGEDDAAIFNIDDPRVEEHFLARKSENDLATTAKSFEQFDYFRNSWSAGALEHIYVPVVWRSEDGSRLKIFAKPPLSFDISASTLPGQHNISNLAAALGAVVFVTRPRKHRAEIQQVIRTFQTLPHRLEIVASKNGITWVNDSQSTIPDATIAALKAFPAPVSLIVGGRAKIGPESYENLMRAVKAAKAKLYLIGEAVSMLKSVGLSIGVEKSLIFEEYTLAEAVRDAKINAASSETVVLSPACASFDQFSSYEHRGETFRQLVNAANSD